MHKQVSSNSKAEPISAPSDSTEMAQTTPNISPPKVDYATDLFNMLSMGGPSQNVSESSSLDGNAWAGFQCKCFYIYSAVTMAGKHLFHFFCIGINLT